ncbi:MAG: DNA gyrase inhibitor YacG [Hyphomonadaceae bacterium]|nr:DNA gyrase inhibitor YacG [Hyphomonadaceae bacterium]
MTDDSRTAGGCVICGKPKDEKYKPFCSKRCADVDLNRWFSGAYAIPATQEDEPDDEDRTSR